MSARSNKKLPAPFLTAQWRDLAMLNYEIDPLVLSKWVPRGTELDHWNGRTFVSVVAFRFLDTRLRGIAVPRYRNFEELNLRFYVRRKSDGQWRRGVVFVKEVVPRRVIAWVARWFYNENYFALPMRHEITSAVDIFPNPRRATYGWFHANRWQGLSLEFAGNSYVPHEDSEEAFIAEHYWGYARQSDGGTVEYQVEHPRWSVERATAATLDCDVAQFYGTEFVAFLGGPPSSAFIADGSAVVVRRGTRL